MRSVLVDVLGNQPPDDYHDIARRHVPDHLEPSQIRKELDQIVSSLLDVLGQSANQDLADELKGKVKKAFKCYAGMSTLYRAGKVTGYPELFEQPTMFSGRIAAIAKSRDLTGTCRSDKPWLGDLPRLIFVSDMGDALSTRITFDFLKNEIIENVISPKGRRHQWLWLTKRPKQMVVFSKWLLERGIHWPVNLVAMTSVTSDETAHRATELVEIEAPFIGLSVEPLWTPVKLPLASIDWVIVGGESGQFATPFHLEWARDIRQQCENSGVAFFLKQLGRNPYQGGKALTLRDSHGGDWSEWPEDLQVRKFPLGFCRDSYALGETKA